MLKHFLPFIIAVLLFLAVDRLIATEPFSGRLEANLHNYLRQKLENIQTDDPKHLDILVLGTSRTLYGFSTETFQNETKTNAYNMGLVAGDYYLFKILLDQHLKKYGKPKMVMLEICDLIFNTKRTSDTNNMYYRTLIDNNPQTTTMILNDPTLSAHEKFEINLNRISGFYRYRTILAPPHLKNLLPHPQSEFQETQGWVSKSTNPAMTDSKQREELFHKRLGLVFDSYEHPDTSRLISLLNYCKGQGIPIVLFQWPTHPTFNRMVNARPVAKETESRIQEIRKQYNLPMIVLTQPSLEQSNQLFADGDHLNRQGALLYTRALARQYSKIPN